LFIALAQHDDQDTAAGVVEQPVEDDHRTHDLDHVGPADLADHDQRQMPAGDQ
jgi:hypothetical protein